MNKSAKVRMLLRRNPNIKASAVIETLDCTLQQAHVMLNTQRKKLHIFKRKDGVYVGKSPMQSSVPRESGSVDNPSIVEVHYPITMESDPVNHPEHYKVGGIETIDFIEAKQLNYNLGNVVKYVTRADHKGNRLEDLEKARWYLDREIGNLSEKLATSK
jgi:hypothetical protein